MNNFLIHLRGSTFHGHIFVQIPLSSLHCTNLQHVKYFNFGKGVINVYKFVNFRYLLYEDNCGTNVLRHRMCAVTSGDNLSPGSGP